MVRLTILFSFLLAASLEVLAQPKIVSVVNAASSQPGLPYGGALATVYVSGLSGLKPGTYTAPLSQALPYSLGGVAVLVNGAFAPILSVIIPSEPSASIQVNFQVPLERNAVVGPGGASSLPGSGMSVSATISSADMTGLPASPYWGGFFADANGYATAVHASDLTAVTAQNPAHPGESIIAYADSFFLTWPPAPIGIPAPTQVQFQVLTSFTSYLYLQAYPQPTPCSVPPRLNNCINFVTNTPALQITFEGLAAGKVGIEEIDFLVPANQQPGNWALFFNLGSCPDGSGVPGTCGASGATSSPYVLLPVGGSRVTPGPVIKSVTNQTTNQSCNFSQDPNCTITASQKDVLQIDGAGFSPSGGNTIHFVGSGGDWWLYEQDGYIYTDASRMPITAQLACYLSPGSWMFSVRTPGTQSTASYPISITGSASCL